MLIIEKNKLYEEIEKEEKKIYKLENIEGNIYIILTILVSSTMIFLNCFFHSISVFFMIVVPFLCFLILFILTFTINKININKILKRIEDVKIKFNEIYKPNNFEKVSQEIVLLDKNNNINLINENLIEDLINHKKESETKKSKLDIFKKNSQEIENT